MMRLNTVGTGSWQARNAGRPRQLRNLALAGVLLLGACGRSETDRETEAAANAANPAGYSPARAGLSAVISSGAFAAVSADESRAAEIGRDILQSGWPASACQCRARCRAICRPALPCWATTARRGVSSARAPAAR